MTTHVIVTVATALQCLVGVLAVLLYLQARAAHGAARARRRDQYAIHEAVDFEPWLIIRWDDEARTARTTTCTRSPAARALSTQAKVHDDETLICRR